jgi:hypothetical protein
MLTIVIFSPVAIATVNKVKHVASIFVICIFTLIIFFDFTLTHYDTNLIFISENEFSIIKLQILFGFVSWIIALAMAVSDNKKTIK